MTATHVAVDEVLLVVEKIGHYRKLYQWSQRDLFTPSSKDPPPQIIQRHDNFSKIKIKYTTLCLPPQNGDDLADGSPSSSPSSVVSTRKPAGHTQQSWQPPGLLQGVLPCSWHKHTASRHVRVQINNVRVLQQYISWLIRKLIYTGQQRELWLVTFLYFAPF